MKPNPERIAKIEEYTVRYEDALKLIRAGLVPNTEELQWFAETSMEFAETVAHVFKEAQMLVKAANMLLTAISDNTDPKTMHPDVVAAVMALGILLGHINPDELNIGGTKEVLQ